MDFSNLSAIYVNCTLKRSPEQSHTEGLMRLSKTIMRKEGVTVDELRLIDHEVASGVFPNMEEHGWPKDEWPELSERILRADILVIGTPIWLGEKSSEAQKLIERLYSLSGQTNSKGQYIYYGKVGGCCPATCSQCSVSQQTEVTTDYLNAGRSTNDCPPVPPPRTRPASGGPWDRS